MLPASVATPSRRLVKMDRVFAVASPGKAYAYRYNYSTKKWENVGNKRDSTSYVSFRKRSSDRYFIRIVPEGGDREEYQLSRNAQIIDSGKGFIQVLLPRSNQLIGIKFKQEEESPIFFRKIDDEMDLWLDPPYCHSVDHLFVSRCPPC